MTDPEMAPPLRSHVLVADGFLPAELAEAMRQDIEAHFADPLFHQAETHQVWNYWFVPELYTYLRTTPEKVINPDRVDAFLQRLRGWALGVLGMAAVTPPYLSLYIAGCRQGWHNDAANGRFGYVYSLTRNERHPTGGETLVMHEGDLFRDNMVRPAAGSGLYDAIEPRFNRLVVFDDRLLHAVERVGGVMDPVEGRIVLHGHISEAGIAVAGALPPDAVAQPIATALNGFAADAAARAASYHGPLAVRLTIDPTGAVAGCTLLLDRVIHPDRGHTEWEPLRDQLLERLRHLKFPTAEGETSVIQPIVFGAPLPQS
jgi:hypothetical protein